MATTKEETHGNRKKTTAEPGITAATGTAPAGSAHESTGYI